MSGETVFVLREQNDWHKLKKILEDEPTNFKDLWCQDCGKSCSSYRKWINSKKTEFTAQKNVYEQQKKDATSDNGNKYDSNFVGKLNSEYKSIDLLLQKLGPCSKKDSGEGNGKDILDFSQPDNTFKDADNCKPCPKFKIDCEKANCTGGGGTNDKCDGNNGGTTTITASDIKNKENTTEEIVMLVSDDSTKKFEGGLEACRGANIFKSIKENKWTCGNVCGYVVCKPKNGNGKNDGENPIITITALVTHWVQNFLEDYKKIKHKISHCIKKGEPSNCINGCNKKCNCVEQWITKKSAEWTNIKNRFNEQYKNETDKYFNVKSFLETLIPQIGAAKDKDKVIKLSKFKDSKGCCVDANSQKRDGNDDAIDCMITNLQKKIEECKQKHTPSGENQTQTCQEYTPPDDDDQPIEEENPVTQPNICPLPTQPKQEEDDEKCEPESTATPEEPAAAGGEQTNSEENPPVLKPEEEAPQKPVPDPGPSPEKSPPKSDVRLLFYF
ncbi:hypothetical protein PFTANZ_06105 [Plasmodium falciparum Tanzania (2000708)]|uniref:Duffy-binding-like domain-containing protein n=1 Tax=Plasmodium falciparum Tanzania (2000708) TaxID=1036725 RepID=A0A024VY41_PLAFA|nr:hypothetical protein PFTANZ_06105 [Plasmodium falciparum Tanzania (2000708)]